MRHYLHPITAVALLTFIVFATWAIWFHGWQPVDQLLEGNRALLYSTVAGLSGSLLGFTIAVIAIFLSIASGESLAFVRDVRGLSLVSRVLFGAIRSLGIATIIAIVGLIGDRDAHPVHLIFLLFALATMLAIVSVIRCIRVFEKLITITAPPEKADESRKMLSRLHSSYP